ncbi:MAG: hypothetical protein KVP17_001946 [Porospora cf. gigantea B]|uniref:uncharacterized protein n=1 Tax=Porospora cf. gigantea B TaxID=2853592 RepID=UPI0035718C52|nr:MAG: hypothetical protein KVP17_001946 [Porospora cf. gigantea B]
MISKLFIELQSKAQRIGQNVQTLMDNQFQSRTVETMTHDVILEASSVRSAEACGELCRTWTSAILASGEPGAPLYRWSDESEDPSFTRFALDVGNEFMRLVGDIVEENDVEEIPAISDGRNSAGPLDREPLSFRDVLLRTAAVETMILTIAGHTDFRAQLTGHPDEPGPHRELHKLLSLCLRGDSRLHQDIIVLACSCDPAEKGVRVKRLLLNLVRLLKHDWRQSHLVERSRNLADIVAQLPQDIKPLSLDEAPLRDGWTEQSLVEAHDANCATMRHARERIDAIILRKQVLRQGCELQASLISAFDTGLGELLQTATSEIEAVESDDGSFVAKLETEMTSMMKAKHAEMAVLASKREEYKSELEALKVERQKVQKRLSDLNAEISLVMERERKAERQTIDEQEHLDLAVRTYKSNVHRVQCQRNYSQQLKSDFETLSRIITRAEGSLSNSMSEAAVGFRDDSEKVSRSARDEVTAYMERFVVPHFNDSVKMTSRVHQQFRNVQSRISEAQASLDAAKLSGDLEALNAQAKLESLVSLRARLSADVSRLLQDTEAQWISIGQLDDEVLSHFPSEAGVVFEAPETCRKAYVELHAELKSFLIG